MKQCIWAPQEGPQQSLMKCPVKEVLFGGARGGGKTDGILGKWLIKALKYGSGFNAVFFRKTMPSADDVWERAVSLYTAMGATPQNQTHTIRFANGARVRFRPLERITDADKYQGQNLSDVCVEEAGLYADSRPIDRLHGVLRSVHGVPTQLILTANPGGAGHNWIKSRYIDPAPQGERLLSRKLPNGAVHHYTFIPSLVEDNKILMHEDPEYINRLYLVGSEQLVRAWLEGDWNAVEGAFFQEFDTNRHVVDPFPIPEDWLRYRSGDWGSAKPFSIGWWAVAGDDTKWSGITIPRGCLVRYREWYGAQRDSSGLVMPNTGLKMHASDVGTRIKDMEEDELVEYGVLDPSAFAEDGGPSIAERMGKAMGKPWRKADNKRVAKAGAMGGWDMVRQRLKGEDDDRPMIVFFNTCTEVIRTLPVLQHDPNKAEDLDTDAEDHAADEVRYACMARPWVKAKPVKDEGFKVKPMYIRDFEPKRGGGKRPGL